MAEVVVVAAAAILEDEDVDSLEVDVDLMEADRVALRKASGNVGIVNVAITFPKNTGRNLDVLSEHSYLILILLHRVVLTAIPASYTIILSQEEYDRL